MSRGETASRSPLDKSLSQLTEDDISQVTREDCRRYLKEKGMRRPSWNKAQAIQQVILLKNLLETTTDSDAVEARKKLCIPRPENPPRVVSDSTILPNKTTQHNGILLPLNQSIPCSCPDPSKSDFSGDISRQTAKSGDDSVSLRNAGAAKEPAGQMTIFYGGRVNVYDDMPGCKAEAILQLAANPVSFPQEILGDQRAALWTIPRHLQAAGVKMSPCSPVGILPSTQTVKVAENCQFPQEENYISREDNLEGPTCRKASVQRYLEKRKDRFKNKRKLATSSFPALDTYLNQVGDQVSIEEFKQSEPCSPQAQPPQTHLWCTFIENVPKIGSLATLPDAEGVFKI